MKFEVQLSRKARFELEEIVRWLRSRSRTGAKSWSRRWDKVVLNLENHTHSFGLAPESDDHDEPVYQVIFKTRQGLPYRALFFIRENVISILHIRGPGQDILGPEELK